jgi:hypothetical protein
VPARGARWRAIGAAVLLGWSSSWLSALGPGRNAAPAGTSPWRRWRTPPARLAGLLCAALALACARQNRPDERRPQGPTSTPAQPSLLLLGCCAMWGLNQVA